MSVRRTKVFILAALVVLFFPRCRTQEIEGVAVGRNGMVVCVDEYAARVGINMLKRGGNAVDAAVAVGFALAVTYPSAGNIGGGGFMVVRFPDTGEAVALDFREMAPGLATPNMYLDEQDEYVEERSLIGHLAVGVPGTVRGFELAMGKYGSMPWKDVVGSAVELAEDGFNLPKKRAESFNRLKRRFKGNDEFFKVFAKPDGSPFREGDQFAQKELARSLRLIAEEGADAFYRGKIAALIVADMEEHGGLVTMEDLDKYEASVREPVVGSYKGYEIISMPPPSSGGTILIEMLNILEGFDLGRGERYRAETLHLIAESMKLAYLDRARYLGDPSFIEAPVERLISKEYAEILRKKIDPQGATPSAELGKDILTLEKAAETTHYSVIDRDGLAVAVTYTLNGGFGSGVIAKGTGILLNNEMADFNMKPGFTDDIGLIGTTANLIVPGKRMLSSMTPTIIVKDGRTLMITGSPGGRTIINTVLNVLLNVLEFRMSIREAIDSWRIDHEWMPDVLRVEEGALTKQLKAQLQAFGHTVKTFERQGDAHTIWVDPKTGLYYGAADRRAEGAATGY